MVFDWSISGYPPLFVFLFAWLLIAHWELLISLSLMHAWLLCLFGTLTCWLWWLIILIGDFDVAIFLCFIAISIWDIGMLIVLINYLVCLSIVTLIFPWLFCSLHMYRLIVVWILTWCVDSLACILSWSFFSMPSLLHTSWLSYSRLACVWTWMIYLRSTWLPVAWLFFSYVFASCLSIWVSYLSSYLQPSGFGHFLHFGSYFCRCEALCVLVFFYRARG